MARTRRLKNKARRALVRKAALAALAICASVGFGQGALASEGVADPQAKAVDSSPSPCELAGRSAQEISSLQLRSPSWTLKGNVLRTTQIGYNLSILVDAVGGPSNVDISQNGGKHEASVKQIGWGNEVKLKQRGNDHKADLSQRGDLQKIDLTQLGEGKTATIVQVYGRPLPDLKIRQEGSGPATVTIYPSSSM